MKFLFMLLMVFSTCVMAQDKANKDEKVPKEGFDAKQDEYFTDVKKTFGSLKNQKTENFYINYTTPTPENYPKTLESLVGLFKNIMSIKPAERVFNGRLEIYLWEKRADFLKFSAEFEGFDASNAGGYFTVTKMGWPRVNMPLENHAGGKESGLARNLIVLFHEGTHAMFSQYLTDTHLPTWINEGLADYFAFSILDQYYPKIADDDGSKKRHVQFLKRKIKDGSLRGFRQLFHQQGTAGGADYEAYALSWCLTCILLKNYKSQTVNFIKKVKMSSELSETKIPNGPMSKKELEELEEKLRNASKNQKKIMEDYFTECFKMDLDKFEETVYGYLKKNPEMLDRF